jgi:hypothetical protein
MKSANYLNAHGIFGGTEEFLDAQVLLDPLEEKLNFSSASCRSRRFPGRLHRDHCKTGVGFCYSQS